MHGVVVYDDDMKNKLTVTDKIIKSMQMFACHVDNMRPPLSGLIRGDRESFRESFRENSSKNLILQIFRTRWTHGDIENYQLSKFQP